MNGQNKGGKWGILILWLAVGFILMYIFSSSAPRDKAGPVPEEISLSEFEAKAEKGEFTGIFVKALNGANFEITGEIRAGAKYKASSAVYPVDLKKKMERRTGTRWTDIPLRNPSFWEANFVSLLWMGLLVILLLQMRKSASPGGMINNFTKSGKKADTSKKVLFADVAGMDEEKEEVMDIVAFLKDPAKFSRLGGKVPKGALLVGPPGVGKTLLARAIAGEADVPFFYIAGSDFVEMFVGVGASRVRSFFKQAKEQTPSILFIDELDAIGRHRGAGLGGGHDEREQTLNQILVEMDGFEQINVIIIAATNRPDVLDPALLRPGRFTRQITIHRPDIVARKKILELYAKDKIIASGVDLETAASATAGFSGDDLKNIMNEAAIMAAKQEKKAIEQSDISNALKKIIMGVEKKMKISEKEKEIIAFHETGHAFVAEILSRFYPEQVNPLYEVSINPRGRALGLTVQLPKEDNFIIQKQKFINEIRILFGGRMAEMLRFKMISTGAANDLKVATNLVRRMACEWGMLEELGWQTYGERQQEVFLGKQVYEDRNYSDGTQEEIDKEIRKALIKFSAKAWKILEINKEAVAKIAGVLLEKRSLPGEEFGRLVLEHVKPENLVKELYDAVKGENQETPPWLKYKLS